MVRKAMLELDEMHRNILLMRFSDEMSYNEIAAATGVSLGTVMARLFNAKRKLKKIVKKIDR